jgi:transposase
MRTIPADVEKDCISLLKNGVTYREISKNLGISRSVVVKIRKRNSVDVEAKKTGPKPKITPTTSRLLARMVSKGELQNAMSAKNTLTCTLALKLVGQPFEKP